MLKDITLDEYEELGGDISKINLQETKTTYYDRNNNKEVIKVEFDSKNKFNDNFNLFNVYFEDGSIHRYAGFWITTQIELELSDRYKKIPHLI